VSASSSVLGFARWRGVVLASGSSVEESSTRVCEMERGGVCVGFVGVGVVY
jgi:hypothetical protein